MIDALAEFGIADAADVAIVTGLLYASASILRRTQAALVALGIALLAGIYLAAGWLELFATTLVLQGLFAAAGLSLVVIFQDELRQAFEELAAWVVGRHDDHRPRLGSTEVLVGALAELARQKTGALVVLVGLQKLDRHLLGGEELGGKLSAPLLDSLFDPHSAGHDGAVIIEDRHVSRFGVQLPLSKNLDRLPGCGTRHSAALGLSERADALCLVVSEERGSISVAAHGQLREIRSEAELTALVNRFLKQRRRLSSGRPLAERLFQDHWVEKTAAVVLAFGLWLLLAATSG